MTRTEQRLVAATARLRYATPWTRPFFERDVERLDRVVARERAETLTVLPPARRRIGRT